jgi:Regulator of chromosome condensation (RCC1) repeat
MGEENFGFLESEALKDQKCPGMGKRMEPRPVLIPELNNITKIACGKNHAVALKSNGDVFTWGSNEMGALGRRVGPRRPLSNLKPMGIIKKKISNIYCGSHHTFAVQSDNTVWSWGWNSHGQTGIPPNNPADLEEVIMNPQKAEVLSDLGPIRQMDGGDSFSVAIMNNTRQCCVWGRIDEEAVGLDISRLDPDFVMLNRKGEEVVLTEPTIIMPSDFFNKVALGPRHGIGVMNTGRAFSWGDNMFYQIGHKTNFPVKVDPLRITNPYIQHEKFVWAGAGEEYGMLATKYVYRPAEPRKPPEVVIQDPGPSLQGGRGYTTSISSRGSPTPSPMRPASPPAAEASSSSSSSQQRPHHQQQGVEPGSSSAAASSSQQQRQRQRQQSLEAGTSAAPISISTPGPNPKAPSTVIPSIIRLHLASSNQTVDVSASATGAEIAATLYAAVNWTKPKVGWWWKPAGGSGRDVILDDVDENSWSELLEEGRKRRRVYGLSPNEWMDSP